MRSMIPFSGGPGACSLYGSRIGCQILRERDEGRHDRHETSADRWLPVRQDPLRNHRRTTLGLHVPLHIEPRLIQCTADSGRVKTRWVCPECGCWICGASSADNGLRRVRSGTLDDTFWLRPTVHFWTRSKRPWITLPEGDQVFETQPAT
jgi:Glutathione-dependent formaldehyde-activating enzyme